MRIKKAYYDTSRTLVFSVVLFNKDINEADHRALDVAGKPEVSVVDALHALLTIARQSEVSNAKQSSSKAESIG